jgi:hypothetical protein
VIHDPEEKLLIMVMEFMPGGAILSSIGHGRTEPLPEALARSYFRYAEICSQGLAALAVAMIGATYCLVMGILFTG